MTWSYHQRWGRVGRGEPLQPIAVYRQSARGELQAVVDGKWTTVPGHLAPEDTMLDLIPEPEGFALAASLTRPSRAGPDLD